MSQAIITTRFLFPEDRTSFVYGRPGDPIRTPPRTGLKIFLDEEGTKPADILDVFGNLIPYATIYTQEDSLLPEFFGPEGYISRLHARVVGGPAQTYPLMAQYSDRLANLPMLTTGTGPPTDDIGAVGSYYIDRDLNPSDPHHRPEPVLYGPRTPDGWPTTGVTLIGPQGPPGADYIWYQPMPAEAWFMRHPLDHLPNVTLIDSAGQKIEGDIEYPPGQPDLVIARFGAPESGLGVMT